VKTIGFKDPSYVGDPINAVRIFSEKEVDELVLLDIEASRQGREPDYGQIRDIVSEAFMPVGYGGGVTTTEQARRLASLGVEKVVVNHAALSGFDVVRQISDSLGAQSTVVAVDVKRNWRGQYRVFDATTGKSLDVDAVDHVRQAANAGAGEVFVNDVTRDGTGKGYDIELVRRIVGSVDIPVVVCGGAGSLEHVREAAAAGASGVAAGSMFVYLGRHRAVMINYPAYGALQEVLGDI
jgi:cyclase